MNHLTEKCPKVSVVMPVYRCEKYIIESINSILNQTYTNFELIIVSDESTPEMRNILKRFQNFDSRLIVTHQDRKGLIFSRNQCCQIASGSYIAIMDCDDISIKERLASQVQFLMKNPAIGVVGAWYKIIDESGNISGSRWSPALPMVVRWTLIFGNTIGHGTVMIRRDLLEEVGFYNIGERGFCEDYDLLIRLLKITNIATIPKFLLKYRIHKGSITHEKKSHLSYYAIEISRLQIEKLLDQPLTFNYAEKLYMMRNINDMNEVDHLVKLIEKILTTFIYKFPCSADEKKQIKKDASIRIAFILLASAKSTHFKSLKYLLSGIKLNPFLIFDICITLFCRFVLKSQ